MPPHPLRFIPRFLVVQRDHYLDYLFISSVIHTENLPKLCLTNSAAALNAVVELKVFTLAKVQLTLKFKQVPNCCLYTLNTSISNITQSVRQSDNLPHFSGNKEFVIFVK